MEKRNGALSANPNMFEYPAKSDINITVRGSDWYWAVTAVMVVSTFGFMAHSFTVPRSKRVFHYITAAITLVASIAYFTMASNLGYAAIPVEFQRSSPKVAGFYREIFYVRYIDWFVTTPLLLLDLLLTAGLPWPAILYTLLIDEVMVITGLVGALVASAYKWGYFVFATFALFYVAYSIGFVSRRYANSHGPNVGRTFLMTGVWTVFLWFLYPIAWGLSEGGNVIAPDSEAIFYGILDILAKPVFGMLLLWGHRNIDPRDLGLLMRDYDQNPNEKIVHAADHGHNQANPSGLADGEVPAATGANGANPTTHTAV